MTINRAERYFKNAYQKPPDDVRGFSFVRQSGIMRRGREAKLMLDK